MAGRPTWWVYKMVAQNWVRMNEQYLLVNVFIVDVDVTKCLKQVRFSISLDMRASYSEVPCNTSTMVVLLKPSCRAKNWQYVICNHSPLLVGDKSESSLVSVGCQLEGT